MIITNQMIKNLEGEMTESKEGGGDTAGAAAEEVLKKVIG